MALSLTLLGGFQARLDLGGAVSLPTRKTQALLAYLGVRPGGAHPRDKLAALLWGESSDARARDGLRHALLALRRALSVTTPPILLVEGQTLALNPAVVDVDVARFERGVADGTPDALEEAAGLYQGDLLQGFSLDEPLFEDWLVPERERLRELALEALARLLACQSKTGATERAIQTAVRLLALDPLQEAVHRALMRLYLHQHRRGAALKQYQLCVDVLQRELGSEPEPETKQLYLGLLRRHPPDAEKAARARQPSRRRDAPPRVELPSKDTPLFGREADRARLSQALGEASHGRGQLMLLLGEAGIGKTSLLGAFAGDAMSRQARVLLGRCYESTQILPFGPWVDAVRAGTVLADEAVLGALDPAWRAELTRLFPEIAAPGLPPPSDNALRLFDSVARLLEHLAVTDLLVLMLEDVHWADEMSLRLLAFMARRIPSRRLLLVMTSRDEELVNAAAARRIMDEICREPNVTRATLAPLARPDIIDLIHSLARGHGAPGALAQLEEQVWMVSEGNPFVAVETTRALLDGALLPVSPRLLPPERVRAMIAARLDRLSDPARLLAAVAAVIGREFEFGLLHRASGLDEAPAAEAVEELVRGRVLHGIGERFDFTHHRLQAVAYDRLLPPRRKLLHRRVGEALEALPPGDATRDPLALGLHFREGEVWDKAVAYLRAAGVDAMARSAHREAAACLEQALAVSQRLPETREGQEQAIDIRLDLRSPLQALGDFPRQFDLLREAERLADALRDQRRLGWVLSYLTQALTRMGDHHRAIESGQSALAMAEAVGDIGIRVVASLYLGHDYFYLGDHRRATEFLRQSVEALRTDSTSERFGLAGLPAVVSRGFLVWSLAELGQFADGIACAEDGVRIAEAVTHPYSQIVAYWADGYLHIRKGDFDRAIRSLERGLMLCQATDIRLLFANVASSLGAAYALSGRLAEAVPLCDQAEEAGASMNVMSLPLRVGWLAEVYLLAGRIGDAAQAAHRALDLSRARTERGWEAWALRLFGEIHSRRDLLQVEEAEAPYRQAMALANELGMRPLEAHCHLGLGKLYGRIGCPDQGQKHLTTAATIYHGLGMQFWLEKAEAEMKA